MTSLESALRSHAHRFRTNRGAGLPPSVRAASDEAIERLIAWSIANEPALADRGPEGSDPAFGVVPAAGIVSVWRVYPRAPEGGKVTLLSKAEHLLTDAERREIVGELEQLQPPKKIGPGQRLEIGLPRLASASQWARYLPLLVRSLRVANRHHP